MKHEKELLADWVREQSDSRTVRPDLISEAELHRQSAEFLEAFLLACKSGGLQDVEGAMWDPVLDCLAGLSRGRAAQGFTPSETAAFIFSLKKPLFDLIRREFAGDADAVAETIWTATTLVDRLGLYTIEVFQQGREEIIKRQQMELLELSTPVVKVWDGILALPLIGTLDSSRTQVVMENLLQSIVDTGSTIAIIDITGVPMVDTLVAQHLLKTVAAAKLMGAQCIISGIRPQIAQTMVHLGVAFGDVVTKASLADALSFAFRIMGLEIGRMATRP